jgi:hypothetical protein
MLGAQRLAADHVGRALVPAPIPIDESRLLAIAG